MDRETKTQPLGQQHSSRIRKRVSTMQNSLGELLIEDRYPLKKRILAMKKALKNSAHPQDLDKLLNQWQKDFNQARDKRQKRLLRKPLLNIAAELPIAEKQEEIIRAIRENSVLIICGETGSGKTTQLPKLCLAAGQGRSGRIGCTQPRRIAAVTVASRIAQEMGEKIGETVGYKIRFKEQISEESVVKIMTDGILLAETQQDLFLNQYDTIIIDEAHERSLNIDFLLGILRDLIKKRRDLKVIITSATLDTEKFSQAFDDAPVKEVSGRVYPVELRYSSWQSDDLSYVERAAETTERLLGENRQGDILIFMPTEQDIRDTCKIIESRQPPNCLILPLFARLSYQDQSRIFKPIRERKVIVATNIAETSLTIPGIKYVIDTGLARISTYSSRNRTMALPVSPISQSSADQRKGRCGRVENGVCIRLYDQEDYEQRPQYTSPEILRTSLAEVILRMLALRIKDIAHFPFLDKPSERNINDGFKLLEEIGAIEKSQDKPVYSLTPQGRVMAQLPLDPRIARMLLEAEKRGCLQEMLVIASALSIQDPRERPVEKTREADQKHAVFKHPLSDFMAYLSIWESYQQVIKSKKSHHQLRNYCHEHYLSARRMREFQDIHKQLTRELRETGHYRISRQRPSRGTEVKEPAGRGTDNFGEKRAINSASFKQNGRISAVSGEASFDPLYTALHKSILAGFLSNIACKKEKQLYLGAKEKKIYIHPGSGQAGRPPSWFVCSEVVETSRPFARNVAAIDPAWLEEIGTRLCKHRYQGPHFSAAAQQVMAWEQVSLFGLPIVQKRLAAYGPVNHEKATELFLDEALIQGKIEESSLNHLPAFYLHNKELIEQIRGTEGKIRKNSLLINHAELAALYKSRISKPVFSVKTLNSLIREKGTDDFLKFSKAELLQTLPGEEELADYPDYIDSGAYRFSISYLFKPDDKQDGITLNVPANMAHLVPVKRLDYFFPKLLKEKIILLLKALPKEYRRKLTPLAETAALIAKNLARADLPLNSALSQYLYKNRNLHIPVELWALDKIPEHLKIRFSIRDNRNNELREGREPQVLRNSASGEELPRQLAAFKDQWEQTHESGTEFPQALEPVEKIIQGQVFRFYPGLSGTKDSAAGKGGSPRLLLYKSAAQAAWNHRQGVALLIKESLKRQLKTIRAALVLPDRLQRIALYFGGMKNLENELWRHMEQLLFQRDIRSKEEFKRYCAEVAGLIFPFLQELTEAAIQLLAVYEETRTQLLKLEKENRGGERRIRFFREMKEELDWLMPKEFLSRYQTAEFLKIRRYLKGLALRAAKGSRDPVKYHEKYQQIRYYLDQWEKRKSEVSDLASFEKKEKLNELRWLIEEYKLTLLAQEIKSPLKVSVKRLNAFLEQIDRLA